LREGAYADTGNGSIWYPGFRAYFKESNLTAPGPADLWVFVDEHPDSINDGWLESDMANATEWQDVPSCLHNRACDFNFADGHSEIHKWLNALFPPSQIIYGNITTGVSDSTSDITWMHNHTSVSLFAAP
jgi:hypothetical protein